MATIGNQRVKDILALIRPLMRCRWLGLMAILGTVSFPLVALPVVTYSLSPSDTVLVFRAFILSMFPIQGHFRVF